MYCFISGSARDAKLKCLVVVTTAIKNWSHTENEAICQLAFGFSRMSDEG
jgi:hypothetical protein